MNAKIIIGIILIVIGLLVTGAGLCLFIFGSGGAGSVDDLAAANARATEELVDGLRDTIDELTSNIGQLEQNNSDLRADNQRLTEHIRDAIRVHDTLAGTVETSGAYTASAVEVSARLRTGIEALETWYNNVRSDQRWLTDMGID